MFKHKNMQREQDLFRETRKFNTTVKLTEEDKKAGVRIYCNEPYAQELYDKYRAYEKETGTSAVMKDLNVGDVCQVVARQISFKDKCILTEVVSSGLEVTIPFKEFSRPLEELQNGINLKFLTMIVRANDAGEYYGSEKKCLALNYKQELFEHLENNTWFEVKLVRLIKGGYVALYKDTLECFVPGSHAAANVVRDFSQLLNKTITVMVDNFDKTNDLFILSYKKYITESMPTMISELRFGKKYTGKLTNKPYDFGIFVEFNDYYTGLIHMTEFSNYDEVKRTMKSGDEISFYIKDVTTKGNQYRIVLTLDETQVNSEKLAWDQMRERTENKSFEYDIDKSKNSIKINIDGNEFEASLRKSDVNKDVSIYPLVKVSKVDPINKKMRFEFVEREQN